MYESHGNTFVHNALHPNAVGHRLGALYVLLRLDQDGLLPLSTPWAGQPTPRDRALAKVAEETMQPPESVGGVGAGEVLTGEE